MRCHLHLSENNAFALNLRDEMFDSLIWRWPATLFLLTPTCLDDAACLE